MNPVVVRIIIADLIAWFAVGGFAVLFWLGAKWLAGVL